MAAGIKEALVQYCDVREEIKDLRARIENLEEQIKTIEQRGYIKDIVKGGSGGTQHFAIEGCPYPEYTHKKTLLLIRRQCLKERELKSLELTNEVEQYINEIQDSRTRRMITYRFLDNLTWLQVANRMGGMHTADSCQKAVERFLKKY